MKSDDPESDLVGEFESLWVPGGRPPDARNFLSRYPNASARERLDVVLLDQTRTIQSGLIKQVELYLDDYPELSADPDSKFDLVYNEFRLLLEAGAAPDPREYGVRFPDLEEALSRQIQVNRWLAATLDSPSWYSELIAEIAGAPTLHDQPPTSEPLAPLPPDDFELGPELGRGGMGTVYKAYQKSMDRHVALKLLKPSDEPDRRAIERFIVEARALGRLRSPHIIGVHGIGRMADGNYFLIMDLVVGSDLATQLKSGPLEPRMSARIVEQVAVAIHHAHQNGVIHRDLKPSNVLIASDGRAIVSDFGLAKRFELDDPALTRRGEILGTPHYMAPEQADHRWGTTGPRTDVYGLGALLYALLSGRPPFEGISTFEVLTRVCSNDRPPALGAGVPAKLRAICETCLRKDPAGRFASAGDVAECLKEFQRLGDGAQAVARRRRRTIAAALGVLGLASALSSTLWPSRDKAGNVTRRIGSNLSAPEFVRTKPSEISAPAPAAAPATPSRSTANVTRADPQATPGAEPSLPRPIPPPTAVRQLTEVNWTIRRGRDNKVRELILEPDALRSGDTIALSCRLSQPSYAYLFWIDSAGDVQRIFPGDSVDGNKACTRIQWPSDDPVDARIIDGPSGMEVLLMVVLDEPSNVLLSKAFEQAIKPIEPMRERPRNHVWVDGIPLDLMRRGIGGPTTLIEVPASLERLRRVAKKSIIELNPRAEVHTIVLSHELPSGGNAACDVSRDIVQPAT
jgi:serine/threonine protein kinase